jgi:hypothetical protein
MFEADLLDEEIKKKKRRVLVVLLVLLLGTAGALPFVGVIGAPSAAAPESTSEPATHTVASTNAPHLPTHEPTHELVETTAPAATPQPTATSIPIPVPPTATEDLPGGAGGGELEASPTPTGAPAGTPVPPMPTAEEPYELPITGASMGGFGKLTVGLAAFSVGVLMLAVGLALRGGETPAAMPRPAPITAAAQTAQEEPEQPPDVSAGLLLLEG